jgi:predicted ATPase/DNA-binding NarL/FixJ family response regulator
MEQPAFEQGAGVPGAARSPHNLPAALTPFVGREAERAQVVARLREPACRLLTITGAGGAGKTRLALEAGRALAPTPGVETPFAHGVALIPLALASSEDVLATTIATALGITLSGPDSPAAQVGQFLREKALLLILDNFEQVVSGAPFVAALLQDAAGVKILATSRERLNVRGERVFELSGLAFPDDRRPTTDDRPPRSSGLDPTVGGQSSVVGLEGYDAIRLFVQTAQAVEPSFELTAETAPAIARICRMGEGLPLGIELAAAWARVLSPDEIAHEIGQNLDFLTSATHDLPERQQSLRAVFDYSWNLLSAAERQALRRLSVFRASFTREAASAVLSFEDGDVGSDPAKPKLKIQNSELLTLLASLVDKSLLRRVGTGSTARYEVLELLRQYAAEQLERAGETAAIAARYADYYGGWLAARTAELRGPGQLAALAAIDAEIEHVRAAWRWAIQHADAAALGRMAPSLFHFYDMRSWFREGAAAFGEASAALASREADQLVYGLVLARHGWFTFHLGQQAEARDLLEQSLAILRGLEARREMVFALNYLGAVYSYLGDYERTRGLCQESLTLAAVIGDQDGRAIGCNILGQAAYDLGAYAEAKSWHQQSLAIEQQTGNRWSMAYSLTNLGKVAYALREYDEARRLLEQGLRTREEIGDVRGVAIGFNRLGDIAVAQGDAAAAGERYAQSLALYREIGNQWGRAASLLNLGRLAAAGQSDAAALRLLQEAMRLALATQAAPQVAQILAAAAPLLSRHGEAKWAAELAALGPADTAALDRAHPHAERLLAWSAPNLQPLALDAALDVARHPPKLAVPAAPQPAAPAYPAGLTAREVAVLRLVSQGLTDAQVADRLVVSPRTVSTHLTSIYGKLGVGSRAGATRFAVEHGLV